MDIELEIVHAKSNKPVVSLPDILTTFTVRELKKSIAGKKPKYNDINRQELRLEPKGKPLKDEQTLGELGRWGMGGPGGQNPNLRRRQKVRLKSLD